jgi:hypothetical protein
MFHFFFPIFYPPSPPNIFVRNSGGEGPYLQTWIIYDFFPFRIASLKSHLSVHEEDDNLG